MSPYYVHILASRSRTLYVGMTSDLARRLHEHRTRQASGAFSAQCNVRRLVYRPAWAAEAKAGPFGSVKRSGPLS
jgi:putative endonuclease